MTFMTSVVNAKRVQTHNLIPPFLPSQQMTVIPRLHPWIKPSQLQFEMVIYFGIFIEMIWIYLECASPPSFRAGGCSARTIKAIEWTSPVPLRWANRGETESHETIKMSRHEPTDLVSLTNLIATHTDVAREIRSAETQTTIDYVVTEKLPQHNVPPSSPLRRRRCVGHLTSSLRSDRSRHERTKGWMNAERYIEQCTYSDGTRFSR